MSGSRRASFRRPGRATAGFTLVELLVVIAVVAVMAVIAVPSFTSMMANSRIRSSTGALHTALIKARSEALKRNCRVTVTRKNGDWSNGWTVVAAEADCDPAHELPPADDSDLTLLSETSERVTVTTVPSTLASVSYLASGRLQGSASLPEFRFSDADGLGTQRCVLLELSGLARVAEGAACD